MVYMGLLNKNEKTSNIFYEDVKDVIVNLIKMALNGGPLVEDIWNNAYNTLSTILEDQAYCMPDEGNVLVFRWRWSGGLSIYIVDNLGDKRKIYCIENMEQEYFWFSTWDYRIDFPDFQRGMSFEISDNMTRYLLGEVYRVD